ncbi:hypothetical protein POM88_005583 [Heracleum sosnowskyi]|uniref:Uncharacterized protein n=1 Tax=Heracleum sosnowskyi TaxID=360622 RepID=A0AAD8J0Y9_9APIA|nr:hypothetical protein POM88_005583 [Heracleum sosnowskyi]
MLRRPPTQPPPRLVKNPHPKLYNEINKQILTHPQNLIIEVTNYMQNYYVHDVCLTPTYKEMIAKTPSFRVQNHYVNDPCLTPTYREMIAKTPSFRVHGGSPSGEPTLSLANGVWIDKSLSFKPFFSKVVDDVYNAVSDVVDIQNKVSPLLASLHCHWLMGFGLISLSFKPFFSKVVYDVYKAVSDVDFQNKVSFIIFLFVSPGLPQWVVNLKTRHNGHCEILISDEAFLAIGYSHSLVTARALLDS